MIYPITQSCSKLSFKAVYSLDKIEKNNNEIYEKIKNADKLDFDIFDKQKQEMDEEYQKEKEALQKKWFSRKKLSKLEVRYAGRREEFINLQKKFIDKALTGQEVMQLLSDAAENNDAVVSYSQGLKNSQAALLLAKNDSAARINKDKGLNRIAGYEDDIEFIKQIFINEVINEKNKIAADVPGGILLFGPTGCGKTKLVDSIAETLYPNENERKIYYKDIKTYDENVLAKIDNALEKARENFEKTHCHTIILLDEIDTIANKDTPVEFLDGLKGKLSEAKENYCTFFLTSNYPAEIHPDIVASNRAEYAISIDPPDRKNKEAVSKYYFDKLNIPDLNYSRIVDTLEECEKDGYFSNSGIEEIYEKCKDIKNITEDDLINMIKSQDTNIDKNDFSEYLTQKDVFINMEY